MQDQKESIFHYFVMVEYSLMFKWEIGIWCG